MYSSARLLNNLDITEAMLLNCLDTTNYLLVQNFPVFFTWDVYIRTVWMSDLSDSPTEILSLM